VKPVLVLQNMREYEQKNFNGLWGRDADQHKKNESWLYATKLFSLGDDEVWKDIHKLNGLYGEKLI
jgi:hypothetical protein